MVCKSTINEECVYWLPWNKNIYWSAEVNITPDNLNILGEGKSQHKR